ncbi:MAG: glycoside hydrolase family 130 protein [Bacteroidales bacterium]
MRIPVERMPNRFYPDFKRVIIRFYDNGEERSYNLVQKILEMEDEEVEVILSQTLREFSKRHRNLTQKFLEHYEKAKELLKHTDVGLKRVAEKKKLLIGSYFSLEYSIVSAAFFNPSIVESNDQTGLIEGSRRVIVSFRATGEGHVSSIVFHTGIIDKNSELHFEQTGNYIDEAEVVKRSNYKKSTFIKKLREMNVDNTIISQVMGLLNDTFIYGELRKAVKDTLQRNNNNERKKRAIKQIVWLADSHYQIRFSRDTHISERVIFPVSYTERKGIEDARFVRFIDDNDEVSYYATYTAYDGHTILPKLIVTKDFVHFEVKPLHGEGAQNKNLALFPRKINGKYVMLSRIDGVSSYIGFSDNLNLWEKPLKIQQPVYPWEYIQVGNCGAPVETSKGWLVITHGVGPMRKYCLGAALLDLEDPTREIGRLKEPLLEPNEEEREGYVPNVVYSCGPMIHQDKIIIPYGLSDTSSGFVSVELDVLLKRLTGER